MKQPSSRQAHSLRRHPRRAGGIVGALAVMLALSTVGCGGGSLRATAVVDVAGNVVSKTMLDHWISVAAVRDYEEVPKGPVPDWVRPDPPRYTRCIAHLAITSRVPGSQEPEVGKLKAQCEKNYRELREQVLRALISAEWFTAEAQQRGLHASDSEIKARFERVKKLAFPSQAAFQTYLSYTGETIADQLFRSKIKLLQAKIEQSVTGNQAGQARERALFKFITGFAGRWSAKTDCRAGLIVPDCRQYKGPVRPEGTSL